MRKPLAVSIFGLAAAMTLLPQQTEARPFARPAFHGGGFVHPGVRPGWHGGGTRWVNPVRPGWHGGGVRWAGRPYVRNNFYYGGGGWGWGWPLAAGVATGAAIGAAAAYAPPSCLQQQRVWNGRRYVWRTVQVC